MPTEFHIEIYLKCTIHTFIEIENHGGVLAGDQRNQICSGDSLSEILKCWWSPAKRGQHHISYRMSKCLLHSPSNHSGVG